MLAPIQCLYFDFFLAYMTYGGEEVLLSNKPIQLTQAIYKHPSLLAFPIPSYLANKPTYY